MLTLTGPVVVLDVTPATFFDIQQRLTAAGYCHRFRETLDGSLVIDCDGLALRDEAGDDQPTEVLVQPGSC